MTTMTKEQFAALINGREYCDEVDRTEESLAERSGLFVLFGASDDLIEIRGVEHDEVGAYNGTELFFAEGKLLPKHDDCECEYCGFKSKMQKARKVVAKWDHDGWSWFLETDIPHATFEILEDGEKYCRGVVFSVDDIK